MQTRNETSERFEIRAATVDDAPAIADLINACSIAEVGITWTTVEETRDDLTTPGRDNASDDALLVGDDGSLVGYL